MSVLFVVTSSAQRESFEVVQRCLDEMGLSWSSVEWRGDTLHDPGGRDVFAAGDKITSGGPMGRRWRRLSKLKEWRDAARRIVLSTGASVVVVGNDAGPRQQAFLAVARERGLGCVLVQDGIIGPDFIRRPLARRLALRLARASGELRLTRYWVPDVYPYGAGGCTKIAVMDGYSADVLVRRGVPADRIEVTGLPRYDTVPVVAASRKAAIAPGAAAPGAHHILLATSGISTHISGDAVFRQRWDRVVASILTELEKLPRRSHVVIRPHPLETDGEYDWAPRSYPTWVSVKRGGGILSALTGADAMITAKSTVFIDALLARVPSIVVTFGAYDARRGPVELPWADAGLVVRVDGIGALAAAVETVLDQDGVWRKSWEDKVDHYLKHDLKADGMAGRRVASLIQSLVLLP